MKTMKKLFGFLLVMVMALTMLMGVNAATVTVDSDSPSGNTYTAYQILTGNKETKDKTSVLTNLAWGDGINSTDFLAALKAADSPVKDDFKDVNDVDSFSAAMNEKNKEAVAKIALANKKGNGTALKEGTNELASGYYLIVDTTTFGENDKDKVRNAAMLQLTDNITIAKKTDKPSVEKKVKENAKSLEPGKSGDPDPNVYGDKYNDVADYNIGDAVPFKLIARVPDTSRYNTYKTFTFTDTLDQGFTAPDVNANPNPVSVFYATSKDAEKGTDLSKYFDVTVAGQVLTVSLKKDQDLKKMADDGVKADGYIIVSYSAVLNSNAEIGLPGNENKVDLTYSNNPDHTGNGDETGKTPEDKVIVFTYELDVTKVDGKNAEKKLEGAEFILKNEAGKVAVVTEGKISDWKDNEEAAKDKDEWITGVVLKSGADGLFKVAGLDDGTYSLKEVKAPEGYNLLKKEISLVITATTKNDQSWAGTPGAALEALKIKVGDKATVDGNTSSGIVGATVENNEGTQLPTTGGMGTRILYILGTILALGAGTLLVVRKRMAA